MPAVSRYVRYIFADIERFTEGRSLEAQVDIVEALNCAFSEALSGLDTIFLPTGDGICAGILQHDAAADVHLRAALRVLERFSIWSESVQGDRCAKVRLAVNESVDVVVTDINGRRNLAGAGINMAQRIMSIADGNQIIAGLSAYETLRVREQYARAFTELEAEVKHGKVIKAYQYKGNDTPFLNKEVPLQVQRTQLIDLHMIKELEQPGGYSTGGMSRAAYHAAEKWEDKVTEFVGQIEGGCNANQKAAFKNAQQAWGEFYRLECDFIGALRETVHGSMYRPLGASIMKSIARERALTLREYAEDWIQASEEGSPEDVGSS